MADPKEKKSTLAYSGGSVRATRGVLEYVFGLESQTAFSWAIADGTTRRGYITRNRTSRAAGRVHVIELVDGKRYQVMVTGATKRFVARLEFSPVKAEIVSVTTARGTEYVREQIG